MVFMTEFVPFGKPVRKVRFDRSGELCFACSNQKDLPVWRVSSMEILGSYEGHRGSVAYIDVSVDSTKILTSGFDYFSHLYDVETGRKLWNFDNDYPNTCCGISNDTKKFFISYTKVKSPDVGTFLKIYQGEGKSPERTFTIDDSTNNITCGIWGPLDDQLILGRDDGSLLFWKLNALENTKITPEKEHKRTITDISISPDGLFLLTTSLDNTIKIWDLNKKVVIKTINTQKVVNTGSFCPINSHIALAGGVESKDVTTTESSQHMIEHRFFDSITCKEFAQLPPHAGPINSLRYNPTGDLLVSGAETGTVRFHKLDKSFYETSTPLAVSV